MGPFAGVGGMSRGQQTFRQRDVTKAVKGALATGVPIASVRVDKDGAIVVTFGDPEKIESDRNEWDADDPD
jgi:hypothetical protein